MLLSLTLSHSPMLSDALLLSLSLSFANDSLSRALSLCPSRSSGGAGLSVAHGIVIISCMPAAGQYTTVRIPGLEVAPRHYTVTSPVGIDTLAYTCRRVPGGVMSNYMHDELHEGDKVLLAPPCGTFMAPGVGDGAVVFTAGVGITPAWALVQTYGGDLIRAAVHVDKSVERDAFRDRFEKAGVHAQVWYTGESETERPDMSTIAQSVATEVGADSTYYVVGPREFMSDVFQGLDAAGATKRFSEVYGTGSLAV